MIAIPMRAEVRQLSDLRLDARTEEELFWRWHYAEGEAKGLHSLWLENVGMMESDLDRSLRCGPVYIPPNQRRFPNYMADLSGMTAYHAMRRIDSALSRCDAEAVAILRRAFHDRPDLDLIWLCPITVRGPVLSNLVELTAAADREWRASRTVKSLRAWLARLAAKAAGGNGDVRLRRELTTAATVLLASAGREYGRWRRMGR